MRLSDLLHIDVVDEDGTKLGSLMDLRGRAAPLRARSRKDAPIDTLVFAAPGYLEHVGIRRATSCEAAWKDVLRVERDRIVVRRNARSRSV
jgi:hypothetical protein